MMNSLPALSPIIPELYSDLLAKSGAVRGPSPTIDLENLAAQTGATKPLSGSVTNNSFSSFLGQMIHEVNAQQGAADSAVNGLLTGQNASLHQAMISVEEASVSFQLMVEVRNRLLDSYQELMRMQV